MDGSVGGADLYAHGAPAPPPPKLARTHPPPLLPDHGGGEVCSCPPFECTCGKLLMGGVVGVVSSPGGVGSLVPRPPHYAHTPLDPYFTHMQHHPEEASHGVRATQLYRSPAPPTGGFHPPPPLNWSPPTTLTPEWGMAAPAGYRPDALNDGWGSAAMLDQGGPGLWSEVSASLPPHSHNTPHSYTCDSEPIFPFEEAFQPQDIFALEQPYRKKEESGVAAPAIPEATAQRFLQCIDDIIGDCFLDDTEQQQQQRSPPTLLDLGSGALTQHHHPYTTHAPSLPPPHTPTPVFSTPATPTPAPTSGAPSAGIEDSLLHNRLLSPSLQQLQQLEEATRSPRVDTLCPETGARFAYPSPAADYVNYANETSGYATQDSSTNGSLSSYDVTVYTSSFCVSPSQSEMVSTREGKSDNQLPACEGKLVLACHQMAPSEAASSLS
nr:uncharacterized protein LOC123752708 [Procambarus clarkii]